MGFFFDTVRSGAYWRYVVLSRAGVQSALSVYGALWLIVETLDFFKVCPRDKYGAYGFIVFLALATVISVVFKRPLKTIEVRLPTRDSSVEVRIGNIYDASGAIMVCSNTVFEADVAGGKIATDSLQGQFTAKYFTGDQTRLQAEIKNGLDALGGEPPYELGTTVPVTTHGKTFYLTAMATLNEQGTASSTPEGVLQALDGLWKHVREAGELQELVVPIVGTGRGRIPVSRKKMIGIIADSFAKASAGGNFAKKLVIMVRPEDARSFGVNLYDVQDHLKQALHA